MFGASSDIFFLMVIGTSKSFRSSILISSDLGAVFTLTISKFGLDLCN